MAVKHFARHWRLRLGVFLVLFQVIILISAWLWSRYAEAELDYSALVTIGLPLILIETILAGILIAVATRPLQEVGDVLHYASRKNKEKVLREELASTHPAAAIRQLDALRNPEGLIASEAPSASRILAKLPIGIVVYNSEQDIIYASPDAPLHGAGTQLDIDFDPKNSLGSWLSDIQAKPDSPKERWWKRMRQAHADSDSHRRFFDVFAVSQKDSPDNLETVVLTIDRSEDYAESEEELDFTSLAAHELRGPITVIKGYLDVLRQELEDKLDADQKAFFERLDVSADRLSTYINNILNVARYDRRHMQLLLKEEKLSRVYAAVADDLALRARTQHRLLNVAIPDDLPTIAADRDSLSEVIINLVDNAIKYSNEGSLVIVSARANGTFVEVSVQDNGIGIPGSIIEHVFDKFYRSHRSRENTVGTGLGLYITKAIIESHGGTVQVRSDEGHGSTFTFSIPTYASVADKLVEGNVNNSRMIKRSPNSIKNHSMYRG